jgi:hypothetical protein
VAFVALGGLQERNQPVVKTGSGNLSWRVEGWSELIGAWSQSATNWVVGQPFGSGFDRRVEGSETTSHPHNFYIETMMRTGVAGLLAILALTAGLLRALWRTPSRDTGLLGPGVIPALLAMQLVWFLTWIPGSEQGIVTGLAVAVAAARRTGPTRPVGPVPGPDQRPLSATGNGRR